MNDRGMIYLTILVVAMFGPMAHGAEPKEPRKATGEFLLRTAVKPFKGVNPKDTDAEVPCSYWVPKNYDPKGQEVHRVFVYLIWKPDAFIEWTDQNGMFLLYLPFKDELCYWYGFGHEKIIVDALAELKKRYRISSDQVFIYGESRAASMVNAFVSTKPEYVSAWAGGVTTFFREPIPRMKHIPGLLLQSEGDDGLYQAAQHFHAKCRKLDIPVLWRSYANIGHEVSEEGWTLAKAFFEYHHHQTKHLLANRTRPSLMDRKNALGPVRHVGDMQDWVYYPVGDARIPEIPEMQRVELPSESVAKAWADAEAMKSVVDRMARKQK
ncbi:MAG: hypothetical protein SFY92_07820 [Verrucomicrobiae bacterium]|nr:hypothetical protein [Verrucomicrobiae bacterium]